jgi:hypothetical protein
MFTSTLSAIKRKLPNLISPRLGSWLDMHKRFEGIPCLYGNFLHKKKPLHSKSAEAQPRKKSIWSPLILSFEALKKVRALFPILPGLLPTFPPHGRICKMG